MLPTSSKPDMPESTGGYAEPTPPPPTPEEKSIERSMGRRMRDRGKPEEQSPTAPIQPD